MPSENVLFEQELLRGEILEQIGALLAEDPIGRNRIEERSGLSEDRLDRIFDFDGVLQEHDFKAPPITLDEAAAIAAALGYRFQAVPVRIGTPGPDWTRKLAAIAGTDAALGALPAPLQAGTDLSDAVAEDRHKAQEKVERRTAEAVERARAREIAQTPPEEAS